MVTTNIEPDFSHPSPMLPVATRNLLLVTSNWNDYASIAVSPTYCAMTVLVRQGYRCSSTAVPARFLVVL